MILRLTYITWPALGLTLCVVLGPVSQVKYLVGGGLVDLPNTAPLGTAGNTVVFGKWAHFGPNEQRH